MRTPLVGLLWVCLVYGTTPVHAQTESEIDVLRAELAQMKVDYESRIALLEKRLDEAELKATESVPVTVPAATHMAEQTSSRQFEPYAGAMTDSNNSMIQTFFRRQYHGLWCWYQ